jgi:hypothetical protein
MRITDSTLRGKHAPASASATAKKNAAIVRVAVLDPHCKCLSPIVETRYAGVGTAKINYLRERCLFGTPGAQLTLRGALRMDSLIAQRESQPNTCDGRTRSQRCCAKHATAGTDSPEMLRRYGFFLNGGFAVQLQRFARTQPSSSSLRRNLSSRAADFLRTRYAPTCQPLRIPRLFCVPGMR